MSIEVRSYQDRPRKSLTPPEIWQMLTGSPVLVFNAMREERPDQVIDLYDESITGFKLAGIDLHNADLRETYFRDVNLSGADFRGAKLERAIFTNCKLNGTLFDGNKSAATFVDCE
jgi:uncharacterized protein YjbI with pentapeptide repeats